jgi:hypothetical protein
MVYSTNQKRFDERILSIPSKDSPSSIVCMVNKSRL